MPQTALIIGGGIGGLTSALALHQAGYKVEVYERAPVIEAIGAGITLTQSAARGLYSLGLKEAVVAGSDNPKVGGPRRRGESNDIDFHDPSRAANMDPPFFQQIHRADLYEILRQAVLAADPECIHLDHEIASYAQDEDGVTAHFSNGASARGDILIGCDGVRSVVRDQMHGPEDPRFTGQVVYRCLIPIERVRQYLSKGPTFGYTAPGRRVLRYVIRHGTVVNVVAFVRTDSWTGEGYSEQVTVEELLSYFPGWEEDVVGLFSNAPPEGTAKWALYDRDPIEQWTENRVALLGDAAHPMLPFLGLGAAMAIEDAVVLGRAAAQAATPAEALNLYEGTRRDRANFVLLGARLQGEITQGEDQERAKTMELPSQNPDLYDYDPTTVALEPAR